MIGKLTRTVRRVPAAWDGKGTDVAVFTLADVPGWEVVAAAARLVDVPLLIASPDGAGIPIAAADYRWGDPEAVRAVADEWMRTSREAHELTEPLGELRGVAFAIERGWSALAAEQYLDHTRRIEDSLAPVAVLSSSVGRRLYELADELDRVIQRQVAAVIWTVASVTAPLATWTVNAAAAPVVVTALVSLTARLETAAKAQYSSALDHDRALADLLDNANGGTDRT